MMMSMPRGQAASLVALAVAVSVAVLWWTANAIEPSSDLTARYILEIVKAFRTAYALNVVEHAKESGVRPSEDWQKDSHFTPLPAQFVKSAGDQVLRF